IGYRVEDHRFAGSASGDCSPAERLIRVSSDASGAQRVKTLVHELAHALLHETFESRALAELEAESVAYVVCQVLGVDSGAYSFGYVASWAGGGDEAVRAIKASCQRIQQAAQAILSARERLCPAGEGTGA
ncbi:MAG TPA: ImmA/IrrE family metallo-endopeptidase, partial [Acidimicrobiales bacterium]|nr:ImmA/IrrE family metallo-endopeptidase [Acidimicrobiales bacterium]